MAHSGQPARFSRAKYFSARADQAIETYLGLFHRYAYICRPLEGGPWFSAKESWQLTDSEILKAAACVHPKFYLGARSGKASKFAVLDIDQGSPYHTQAGFEKIVSLLKKAGIEYCNVYRSSHSGGWHIYIFFDAPVSSRDLYKQLFKLFTLQGFEVAKGKLELFPNPGDNSVGQGLRLPLQPGFAWLAAHNLGVLEERDEISPTAAITQFVRDIECSANPYHNFHQLRAYVENLVATKTDVGVQVRSSSSPSQLNSDHQDTSDDDARSIVKAIFQKLPPGILCASWLRGRNFYHNGLSAPGQRADAVMTLGHYLFYGDPEFDLRPLGYGHEEKRKWFVEEVLEQKHNGYSKDMLCGRADARKHIDRAVDWVPPHRRNSEAVKYEPVVPISWVRNNANRASLAQKKIIAAVEDFREAGVPFSTRDLALKSGVSSRTLTKYPELWKPAMAEAQNARLKTALHEYNAVEGATCSKSQPPASLSVLDMSPGRLAARRIVYELKMRDLRAKREESRRVKTLEKASDLMWQDRVDALVAKTSQKSSERSLQFLIDKLARELLMAPSYEDQIWLQAYISALREIAFADGNCVQLSLQAVASAS